MKQIKTQLIGAACNMGGKIKEFKFQNCTSSTPTSQQKFKKEKQGPRTDTYENLLQIIAYPDSGAFMRRVDDGTHTSDKKPGNMVKYLGETDAERVTNLNMLKAWVGDGAWNLNRWAARGDVPGITKEQLEKIKVKY